MAPLLRTALLLCLLAAHASAESLPVKLDLSRRDLKNFLTDEEALVPYRLGEGGFADLSDIFTLGVIGAPYAVFWDPLSCRLLGILDLSEAPSGKSPDTAADAGTAEPPSPYLLKATGPFPLAKTPGVSGAPRYFGFRLVNGAPEFLYTCGSISIEERLWLEDGGKVLRQRFSAKDASNGLRLAIPADWKDRVEASAGTWQGAILTVPKEAAAEVLLTYHLVPATKETPPAEPDTN